MNLFLTYAMLNVKSWINGLVALLASGGLSNYSYDLAMARAGEFEITLDDIGELSNIVL